MRVYGSEPPKVLVFLPKLIKLFGIDLLISVRPYISVVITAFNRKKYLKEAVASVVKQTLDRKQYEIIVVKNFKDKKTDLFINKNKIRNIFTGQEPFWVEGIKLAKGTVICLLEDDDRFKSNKLKEVYEVFKSEKDLVYYHNAFELIDELSNKINLVYFTRAKKRSERLGSSRFYPDNLSISEICELMRSMAGANASSISIGKRLVDKAIKENKFDKYKTFIVPDFFSFCLALNSKYKMFIDSKILTENRVRGLMRGKYLVDINVSNTWSDLESYRTFSLLEKLITKKNARFALKLTRFYTDTDHYLRSPKVNRRAIIRIFHNGSELQKLNLSKDVRNIIRNLELGLIALFLFPSLARYLYNRALKNVKFKAG